MNEQFDWLKPSPLWDWSGYTAQQARSDLFKPAVLKFTSDDFMEEFYAAAGESSAQSLGDAIAADGDKLYQPLHGCFYLVCASLCCRLAGFPEREVRREEKESTFFVLRRVVGDVEYAWVEVDGARRWQSMVGTASTVHSKEERLPLLPAATGDKRALLFGYIPVASRETYAAPPSQAAGSGVLDSRIEQLNGQFLAPLREIFHNEDSPPSPPPDDPVDLRLSVYMLLDLWEYFDEVLPTIAAALKNGSALRPNKAN